MRRLLALVSLGLGFAAGGASGAAAPEATPVSGVEVPDPALCRVAPRPVEALIELFALSGTPAIALPPPDAASPPPAVAVPLGEPADEETAAGITATAREVVACLNAGDPRRAFALYTDNGIRRFFGVAPEEPASAEQLSAFRAFLAAAPVARAPDERLALVAVANASVLADGRVSAFVVLDDHSARDEAPETSVLIFVKRGDRWLIDDRILPYLAPDD